MPQSSPINPQSLSEETIAALLTFSLTSPGCLDRSESSDTEYKESFNLGSSGQYAKTMAAFANAEGGYLIFGVKDATYKVVGLQSDNFEKFDPQDLTMRLNTIFSPEINWRKIIRIIEDKKVGILYIAPAIMKPVVAKQNNGDIHEAEIFYRYAGRSEKIKYPELQTLLEQQRYRYLNMWLEHLSKMRTIGVENAAILNTLDGTVTGPTGKSYVIDEVLLSKLQFIREGEFDEIDGDPTLKLVGEMAAIPTGQIASVREVPVALRLGHIIHTFLEQMEVESPQNYVEQICHEDSGFLPVYFFVHLAEMTLNDAIAFIRGIQTRKQGKDRLLNRLKSGYSLFVRTPAKPTPKTQSKLEMLERIRSKQLESELDVTDVVAALTAIRYLSKDEVDLTYLSPFLTRWFDIYYTDRSVINVADSLRRAICYVDEVLFKPSLSAKS